jgi:hypothetical protein
MYPIYILVAPLHPPYPRTLRALFVPVHLLLLCTGNANANANPPSPRYQPRSGSEYLARQRQRAFTRIPPSKD